MRPLLLTILSLILITQVTKAQDYSAYNIAKAYYTDHKYLLAYKYLIIFRTANLDRLNKLENAQTLKNLNDQIEQLETALSQNMNWYQFKSARGWSDKVVADSLKNVYKGLEWSKIIMNP